VLTLVLRALDCFPYTHKTYKHLPREGKKCADWGFFVKNHAGKSQLTKCQLWYLPSVCLNQHLNCQDTGQRQKIFPSCIYNNKRIVNKPKIWHFYQQRITNVYLPPLIRDRFISVSVYP